MKANYDKMRGKLLKAAREYYDDPQLQTLDNLSYGEEGVCLRCGKITDRYHSDPCSGNRRF